LSNLAPSDPNKQQAPEPSPQWWSYRGHDEIDRIAGEIRATHLDFRYQPIPKPEETGNGGSDGQRAALVRHQLTPGLISSLPGTGGLPPFISFSTSYPELNSAVLRHTDNERFVG